LYRKFLFWRQMVWEGKNMKKQIDVERNKRSGSVLRLKTSHVL